MEPEAPRSKQGLNLDVSSEPEKHCRDSIQGVDARHLAKNIHEHPYQVRSANKSQSPPKLFVISRRTTFPSC